MWAEHSNEFFKEKNKELFVDHSWAASGEIDILEAKGRSDAIIVLTVNPNKKTTKLLSMKQKLLILILIKFSCIK
ncbi:hypothetical protein P6709_20250, partial [Jeotgalibacillus sp. ET6]|nr:hypothetical protein [Jeotgalibacillus sp. ET6]